MQRLYWEGRLTLEEIGRRFGLSKQRVDQIFKATDAPRRTKADAFDLAASRHNATRGPIEGVQQQVFTGRAPSQQDRGWMDEKREGHVQHTRIGPSR